MKLYYWWIRNGKYLHKDFVRGIRNLIRWFPIIWKDRDWDDHFIWEMWKRKLRNQADYIGKKNRHVSAKRDAEIMMLCYRLMDDIQNEHYQSEWHDYAETKFRFESSDQCEDCSEIHIDTISEHYDDYFKKYPLIYKKVLSKEPTADKDRIAFHMARINHDRARKLLFTLLERNIEGWWD
jgi:nitrate reductase beta subunit